MKKTAPWMVSAALLLVSCDTMPDRGFVQRDWTRNFRELGIVPVFPPREDIVVGDVYAYWYDPNDKEIGDLFNRPERQLTPDERIKRLSIGMSTRMMRLDLVKETFDEYSRTPSFPATTADYNSLLGNPAFAAAKDKVDTLTAKVKGLQDVVDTAKKESAASEAAQLKASRENDDKATALAAATTKLKDAKARFVDASAEKVRLVTAKQEKRDAATRQSTAQSKLDGLAASATPAQKDAAAAELNDAKLVKTLADQKYDAASDDLETKEAQHIDTTQQEKDVADAQTAQEAATRALLTATRAKEDRATSLANVTEKQTPLITAAQADLEAAKAVQKAISDAGARMLYSQPKDDKVDVYSLSDLAKRSELKNSRVNRLRLVAFPEFSAASFTSGDLSALVPIQALMGGLRIASNNVKKVSVKIPAAESYAVSQATVLKRLFVSRSDLTPRSDLKESFQWAAASTNNPIAADNDNSVFFVRIITEVFYARAIDVSIFASSSFGTRAGLQTLGETSSPGTASRINADSSSAAMLADIQQRVAETQALPGGSIQVVSQSESAIGLRRIFDRPIAVGFRSLVIKFSRSDCRALSIGAADVGQLPSAPPQ